MKTKMMRVLVLAVLMVAMLVLPVMASAAAQVGTEAALREAIAQGGEITLTGDITITSLIKIEKSVKIDGQNQYKITSTANKAFEVYGASAESGKIDVTFEDVTVHAGLRAVDTRGGYFNLTLDGAKLKATATTGDRQPLTIGGASHDGKLQNVTIKNSTIEGKYAIITFNPIELVVKGSTLKGYSAYYAKGENSSEGSKNSRVTISGCTLDCEYQTGNDESNNFGAIVIDDANVVVSVSSTKIIAKNAAQIPYQSAVMFKESSNNSFVTLNFCEIDAEVLATDASENGGNIVDLTGDMTLLSDTKLNMTVEICEDFTLNGNNKTITATSEVKAGKAFTINQTVQFSEGADVTFKDVTIVAPLRAIDTRGGKFNLTVSNSTLKGTQEAAQPLTIGGASHDGLPVVKIENSTIEGKYAIITFNPIELVVKGSTLKGYSAYYAKGKNSSDGSEGSIVSIQDSTLNCNFNTGNDASNNFGAFVFEDSNIKVYVQNSTVLGYNDAVTPYQSAVVFSNYNGAAPKQNTVTFDAKSTIDTEAVIKADSTSKNNTVTVACKTTIKTVADEKFGSDDKGNLYLAKHDLTHYPAKDASYAADGNIEHYDCEICGKCYEDAEATKEITNHDDVIIKFVESHGSTTEVTEHAVKDAVMTGVMDVHQADDILTTDHVISGVEISAEDFGELTNAATMTIKLDTAEVAMDVHTLDTINAAVNAAGAESVKLEVKVNEANILSNTQTNAIKNENVAAVISAEWLLVGKNGEKKFTDNFGGKVTVTFPFDCAAKGVSPEDCTLYWLKDDGTLEAVDAKFDGKTCSVTLKHFSEYVVITDASASADGLNTLPKTGDNSQIFLWAGMLMISLCALVAGKKVRA